PAARDWRDPRPGRRGRDPAEWGEPTAAQPTVASPTAQPLGDWDDDAHFAAPQALAGDQTTASPTAPSVWDEPPTGLAEDWADDGDDGVADLRVAPVESPPARAPSGRARRRAASAAPRRSQGPSTDTDDRGPRLPYVPGLDGLRAVALLAILAFHQGYDLVRGGFLGISSFFTLSGFLIGTLLLAEWSHDGRVSLTRFWDRRARRLIPGVVLVLVAVIVLQATMRVGAGPGFRGDVVAAAGQVLNWRFAFGGDGFASVLTDPSPVQHLWAVSMAAQVFLVMPLAFVGIMRVVGTRWRLSGALFGLAAAGSFLVASMTAERAGNDGLAYYSTYTRIGEVLVGVVLAYAVLSPAFRRLMETPQGATVLRYGPLAALVGLAVLWTSTSLYASNLFHGVTAVNALLTAMVVVGVTVPGPAAGALGWLPLRIVGMVSYAAYLVHWPIFLWLDEERTGLESNLLFLARLAATLGVAAVVTWAVERPIRYRLRVPRRQLGMALGTSLALVAAVALILPEQPPRGVTLSVDDGNGAGDLNVVTPAAGDDEVVRIALVGDGLAGSMTSGLETWNADQADHQVRVDTHVAPGCPISTPGPVRLAGETIGDGISCVGFGPRLPKLLDASGADAIVVVGGLADLGEREIDREWRHIGDPVFDDWLGDRYDDLADTLAAQDVPVLWATYPHVRLAPGNDGEGDWTTVADNDPLRVERLNEIIHDTVAGRDDFSVIDLDAWSQDLPAGGAFNPEYRLEGRDFTEAGADAVARWLVPKVLVATGTEPPAEDSGDSGGGDSGGDATTSTTAG
ncbi:MAG TPA: acyltransferase, partial [Acidimicrobiales bacterium]|nr:acyltransferase [Acidimicrobiales bacterium]